MEKKLTVLEILEKWVEYSEYDPNQKSFILGSSNYYMNQASKIASKVLESYDKTGRMSIIMLKESFLRLLKDEKISVLELLENPDVLKKTQEMYEMFCSDTVINAYSDFNNTVSNMYKEVIGLDLIGDTRETYGSWIEGIVNNVERLDVDIYKKGNTPLKIEKFYKKLLVFDSLGEAILSLENAADGVYTCYINVSYTSDSYFGFFVKSLDNFVGFTDRINEAYPGQHIRLNVRNGRWAENKSDNIFPYDTILDYDDYCSKGYAMKFKVKEGFLNKENTSDNGIEFKDLKVNFGYDGLILGMLMLKMKYDGKIIDGEEVYLNSLLSANINILLDNGTLKNEIIKVSSSDIALRNKELNIRFNKEQLLGDNIPFKEFENNELVDIYGDGFEPDYSKIYSSDDIKKLTDKNCNANDIIPEYVGSKERLEKGAYYLVRQQLASYIESKIEKEWIENGGLKTYKNWYISAAKENIHNILALCMEKAIESKLDSEGTRGVYTPDYDLSLASGEKYAKDCYLSYNNYLNERNGSNNFICPITGSVSTIFFVIKPKTLDGIRLIAGKELKDIPNMIRISKLRFGCGNSLLSMVDPVSMIRLPFGDTKIGGEYTNYSFSIALGISKRAFNKLKKVMDKGNVR